MAGATQGMKGYTSGAERLVFQKARQHLRTERSPALEYLVNHFSVVEMDAQRFRSTFDL